MCKISPRLHGSSLGCWFQLPYLSLSIEFFSLYSLIFAFIYTRHNNVGQCLEMDQYKRTFFFFWKDSFKTPLPVLPSQTPAVLFLLWLEVWRDKIECCPQISHHGVEVLCQMSEHHQILRMKGKVKLAESPTNAQCLPYTDYRIKPYQNACSGPEAVIDRPFTACSQNLIGETQCS